MQRTKTRRANAARTAAGRLPETSFVPTRPAANSGNPTVRAFLHRFEDVGHALLRAAKPIERSANRRPQDFTYWCHRCRMLALESVGERLVVRRRYCGGDAVPRCNVTIANATVKVVCTVQSNNAGAVNLAQVTAAAQAAAAEAVNQLPPQPGLAKHEYPVA